MVEIIADEITLSEDIAAGEIVEGELLCEGKRTGVFIKARLVVNNDEMVQLSISDLPRAIREKNGKAAQKLFAVLNAQFN
jgi:hypothetical protein